RHAAHAVAAGCDFRSVIVVDPDKGLGTLDPWWLQDHQLIERHSRRRGYRTRFLRANRGGRIAKIDHDNLVADAVHLGKRMVGERAHRISRLSLPYMATHRRLASVGICAETRALKSPKPHLPWDGSRAGVLACAAFAEVTGTPGGRHSRTGLEQDLENTQ